jgi:hypothetical protein
MSEEAAPATGPNGDAKATPDSEEAIAQLSETLGVDAEDAKAYFEDKGNWDKQINRRLTEIGVEKQNLRAETDLKQAELLEKVATIVERTTTTDTQGKTHIVDPQQFAAHFKVQDWEEGVTAKQLYAAVEAIAQMGTREFGNLRGDLPTHEDGTPVTMAEMHSTLSSFKEEYGQDREGIVQYLSDQEVDRLMTDYPNADRQDLYRAIGTLDSGETFSDDLEAAAKASHDRVAKRVDEVVKKEKKRRTQMPAYTGAGRGAAVAGEKPPDIFSREGIDAFSRRHPVGEVDEV